MYEKLNYHLARKCQIIRASSELSRFLFYFNQPLYIYIYMLKEMWTSTRRPNLSPTSSHMHVNVFPSNCPFTQANPSHAHYFTWFLDYPTVLTPLNSCHYGDPKSKSFVLGDFNFVWRRDCTRTRHYYCEFVIYL